jgi:nucleotide-binding universal stress UspA family protein
MKIMIGFDGTDGARAALDDLRRAGLPGEAEALVVTVERRSVSASASKGDAVSRSLTSLWPVAPLAETPYGVSPVPGWGDHPAQEATRRVQADFPGWEVRAGVATGAPARTLTSAADLWGADLVVVGASNRLALERLLTGGVSRDVAADAPCSVRIARGRTAEGARPVRVLLGISSPSGARSLVREVARRCWPSGSEVRLVTAFGPFARYGPGVGKLVGNVRDLHRSALEPLAAAGLTVSFTIREGDAKQVLAEQASGWGADAIFLGTKVLGRLGRAMLGSVSAAVAGDAPCSVEIVRVAEANAA